jgi:O-antigen ligase
MKYLLGRDCVILVLLVTPWLNPFSPGPSPSVGPWLVSAFCVALLLTLLMMGHERLNPQKLHQLIASAWVIAAVVSSTMGLLQYFDWESTAHPWISSAEPGYAYANLRQRNQLATLTNLGLLCILLRRVFSQRLGIASAAVALLVSANAATASRTGLLQLVVLMGVFVTLGGVAARTRLILGLVGWSAYAAAIWLLPLWAGFLVGHAESSVLDRLMTDLGCSSRTVLWSNVVSLIAQKPWFGWGWGELDYAHYANLYQDVRFCAILDNAHNLPLHLMVELGVPLALVLCVAGVWALWRSKPWSETDSTRQLAWGVLALILLHSLVEYPLWYGPFQIAFGLSLMILCSTRSSTSIRSGSTKNNARVAALSCSVASIAFLIYAACDYQRIGQLYLVPEARAAGYRDDTLAKVSDSWLFRSQVEFAALTLTPLTRENATDQNAMALRLLHYSPEPRVIEKVIESAALLGHDDEVGWHLVRYRAAFPDDHATWAKGNEMLTENSTPTR